MKPDFEAKYRTMMKNMIDKGESFDSIKSSLFVLRDDLLDNAARKLRAEVDGDVAYIFSTTFFNAIFPSSGLLITPAYTLSMCKRFSSAMGIVVSGTMVAKVAKDATVASAESAFIEIITEEGVKIVSQEVATTFIIPVPGAALLVMPYKWLWHREQRSHMINFTHQKAKKYHTDWIVNEMNRLNIRDTNRCGGGGNVGGGAGGGTVMTVTSPGKALYSVRVHIPPGLTSGELILVRLPNGKKVVRKIPRQSEWMYDGSRPFFKI